MSASALYTIFCDYPSCGWWTDYGVAETAAKARKNLQGRGWRLNVPSNESRTRLDYCPQHAEASLHLDG